MNGKEIAALVLGRTITGVGLWADKPWWRVYEKGGKVSWRGPSDEPDFGLARIKGDLLCERWNRIGEGYETCFPVFRNPKGTPEARDEYVFMTDTGIFSWSPAP